MISSDCKEIIQRFSVKKFVEAGTDMGETVIAASQWFSEAYPDFGKITSYKKSWARCYNSWNDPIEYPVFDAKPSSEYKVYSSDLDPYSANTAIENFKTNPNIVISPVSSEVFLKDLVDQKKVQDSDNPLFYLDTHWLRYWPLKDEIRQVVRLNRFIICIDDFVVPGKTDLKNSHCDFGFTFYKGQVLNWGFIKDIFTERKVRIFYPTQANRDRRGWVLIFAGFDDQELATMKELPFFEMDSEDPTHAKIIPVDPRIYADFMLLVRMFIPMGILRPSIRMFQRFQSLFQSR